MTDMEMIFILAIGSLAFKVVSDILTEMKVARQTKEYKAHLAERRNHDNFS